MKLNKNEQEFLDNLYNSINSNNVDDIKIAKDLCDYGVNKCDISDKLLYMLSGGDKHRKNKRNNWLEKNKISILSYINNLGRRFNIKPSHRKHIFNMKYVFIPNKGIDFYIDYINLQGYRLNDKINSKHNDDYYILKYV